ncbi:protein angel homolog 1 [Pelodytes ibericus]
MMPGQHATTCLALPLELSPADLGMEQGDTGLLAGGDFVPSSTILDNVLLCEATESPVPEDDSCLTVEAPLSAQQAGDLNDPAVLEYMVEQEKPIDEENKNDLLWRDWEDLFDPEMPNKDQFDFTVLSYNILSQDLASQNADLYLHCSPAILLWEYRWQNILQELQHWEADIICLQEVQEDHYREHVQPSLSALGYSCHYKRRTGRKTDGCCTCFKSVRFMLLRESHVEYFRPGIDVLNRDNVGLVLLLGPILEESLKEKYSPRPVCVANTHLLYNPRRGDIKLAQLALLLAEVDKVSLTPEGLNYPIILCGDLNATPDSPLYRLLRNGILRYKDLPAWKVSGQQKYCTTPHPCLLPSPLWPDAVGITDHCRFATLSTLKKGGRLVYKRENLLQLRYCECALQRPPNLCMMIGVTDNEPDPQAEATQIVPPSSFADTQSPLVWSPLILQHSLNLTSVYSHFLPVKGRPEVTTIPMGVGSTVDYIFYSSEPIAEGSMSHGVRFYQDNELKLLGRLCLLSEDDLLAAHGLPNPFCCSDHLCLLARFGLDLSAP